MYKVLILLVSLVLVSCKNSIYFYETARFSMTVEAKANSYEPISGNIGYKQQVAVIVPPKRSDDNSEAVSFVSNISAKTEPITGGFDKISFSSVMISGKAAEGISANTVEAVTGAISQNIPVKLLTLIHDELEDDKYPPNLKTELNSMIDEFVEKIKYSANINFYNLTSNKIAKETDDLKAQIASMGTKSDQKFSFILKIRRKAMQNLKLIKAYQDGDYQLTNTGSAKVDAKALKYDLKNSKIILDIVDKELRSHTALINVFNYFKKQLEE